MNWRVITNVVDGVVVSCMLAGDSGRRKCVGMMFFFSFFFLVLDDLLLFMG